MRFLITFSYDGSNYWGYQSQIGYRSVENEMNKALSFINNKKTNIIASGRTDKGVHALCQKGHADIQVNITEYKLKRALNSLLPEDIHVLSTQIVDNNFHARYMVKEKTYEYLLNMGEFDPIKRNYVYQFNRKLDVDVMMRAIKDFIGIHDFKSFTPTKDKKENYVREIKDAFIKVDGDTLIFTFTANGFIKYQIRNMVGLLVQIGLHKKGINSVNEILANKNRGQDFRTVHPEGLYLKSVKY